MASSDTDNDIIISSGLVIASTLYQRRQVNVSKRKRNSPLIYCIMYNSLTFS